MAARRWGPWLRGLHGRNIWDHILCLATPRPGHWPHRGYHCRHNPRRATRRNSLQAPRESFAKAALSEDLQLVDYHPLMPYTIMI